MTDYATPTLIDRHIEVVYRCEEVKIVLNIWKEGISIEALGSALNYSNETNTLSWEQLEAYREQVTKA